MAQRKVEFTFVGEQVKEPVIYWLGHKFPIVTNIRRAQVDADVGRVLLEIDGELSAIEEGLEWVRSQGVQVSPVEGDILAGD
jgi:ABC-type methionine transport system ATPase subunit